MKNFRILVLLLLALSPLARAQVQVALTASRTSGVAPLTVFFDTSGTTAAGKTSRPFHELEYRWNFGDADIKWTRGSRPGVSSKNVANGPLAAHVYETPGTYTATVTVFDGTTPTRRQVSITVDNPNTVFSGTKTVCFSTGVRGFGGCPTGAQQVRTSDFATAINTYKGTGKRLLFRRGETFTSGAMALIAVTGPGIVGAFGAATDPLPVLHSTANATSIQLSSNKTPGLRDWRIMDLNLVGANGGMSYGVSFGGGINQVTLLRLTTQKQRIGVISDVFVLDWFNKTASTAGHKAWDQLALVDSTITAVLHSSVGADKGYGTYMAGERFFYAGNYIDNTASASVSDVSHVGRFPYLAKAVISNNTLMHPGPTEHLIKLHAPGWATTGVGHNGIGGGYSRWIDISDNKIVGSGNNWLIAVGPQNAQSDERVKDVISERNWFVAGAGMQIAQIFFASDVTVRNNIVDATGGSSTQTGTYVGKRGVEPAPARIGVFNEAYYSGKALSSGQFAGVSLASGVTGVVAKNNAAYAPNATSPMMFRNACGGCLTQSNNSSNAQVKFNAPFAVARPVNPIDFKAAGYALGGGTAVPVWSDFFLSGGSSGATLTAGTRRDMGAVVH